MSQINCPSCGLMVQPGWETCKFCRFDLKAHAAAQPPHPPLPPPPPPPPSQYGGYGAYYPPPMVPPPPPAKRNGPILVITGLIVIVALAGAGLFFRNVIGGDEVDHPDEWDPRVADLAAFVEDHRDLEFKYPVYVDFLTPDEYSEAVRADEEDLDEETREVIEQTESTLRALGLATAEFDLFDAVNDLSDSGTLAFYMPDSKRVRVRGTEVDINLKVTLVHELTHALQDQHFDIAGTQSDVETSGAEAAYRALFEGDAVRIETEYTESLSQAEQDEYDTDYGAQVDESEAALAEVPSVLSALQQWPYLLGPAFVRLLVAEGGNDAVDDAFNDPPTTEEQLLDPQAFLGHDVAVTVDEPELPEGVDESFDSGDFGAIAWFLVLAERVDPVVALTAADGWGGDAYVSYEQDGRSCMRIAYAGDTEDDVNEMRSALDQWVAAMPAGAASIEADSDTLTLQSCDPGPDAGLVLNDRATVVMQIPAMRAEIATGVVEEHGVDFEKTYAYSDCTIHRLTFDQISAMVAVTEDELPPDLNQTLMDAAMVCAGELQ